MYTLILGIIPYIFYGTWLKLVSTFMFFKEELKMANTNLFHGFECGHETKTGVSVVVSNVRGIIDTTQIPENVHVNWLYQSQSGINAEFTLESGDPLEVFMPVSTYRVDCRSIRRTVAVDYFHNRYPFDIYVPVNYSGENMDIKGYPIICEFTDNRNIQRLMLLDYQEFAEKNHANIFGLIQDLIKKYITEDDDLEYFEANLVGAPPVIIPVVFNGRYSEGLFWGDDDYDEDDSNVLECECWLRKLLWHFSTPDPTEYRPISWYWDDTNTAIISGTQLITTTIHTESGLPVICRYRWHRNNLLIMAGSEFENIKDHRQFVGENLFGDLIFSSKDTAKNKVSMIKVVLDATKNKAEKLEMETLDVDEIIERNESFRFDFRPLDADGKILHSEDIPEMHPLEPVRRSRRTAPPADEVAE